MEQYQNVTLPELAGFHYFWSGLTDAGTSDGRFIDCDGNDAGQCYKSPDNYVRTASIHIQKCYVTQIFVPGADGDRRDGDHFVMHAVLSPFKDDKSSIDYNSELGIASTTEVRDSVPISRMFHFYDSEHNRKIIEAFESGKAITLHATALNFYPPDSVLKRITNADELWRDGDLDVSNFNEKSMIYHKSEGMNCCSCRLDDVRFVESDESKTKTVFRSLMSLLSLDLIFQK